MAITTGTIRSGNQVKAKINHILSTYKEALEEIHQSGGGLDIEQHESFMGHIHNDVCKYYTQLDIVLGARPNMWAAYTNEMEDYVPPSSRVNNSIDLTVELEDEANKTGKSCTPIELDISDITSDFAATNGDNAVSSKNKDRDTDTSSSSAPESPRKKKKTTTPTSMCSNEGRSMKKLSLLEGNKARRQTRKSISDKKVFGSVDTMLEDESNMKSIMQAHKEKMDRQCEMHAQSLQIQTSMLNLESQRTIREERIATLKEAKLKGEIMKTATEHNSTVLQKRLEMKRIDPNLTESYLDSILPFRKIPNNDS